MTVDIYESIKKRRESLRLTQTDLANRATEFFDGEIKPNYINRLERGLIVAPSYPRIEAIKAALGVFEAERNQAAQVSQAVTEDDRPKRSATNERGD